MSPGSTVTVPRRHSASRMGAREGAETSWQEMLKQEEEAASLSDAGLQVTPE